MENFSGKRVRSDELDMQADASQSWQGPPRKRKEYEAPPPNHVLLLTILNPAYPITVEVLHAICSPHSRVLRIVTFQKTGMQAMIEFESVEGACAVREAIDGADIYSGCCTVRAEFAKPTRLNVFRNDSRTWDYTLNMAMGESDPMQSRKAPLLPEPMNYSGNGGATGGPVPGAPSVPMDGPYGDMRGGGQGAAMGEVYGGAGALKYPGSRSGGNGGGGGGNFAVSAGIYRAAQEFSRNGGGFGQDMYTMTMRDDRRAPVMPQHGTVLMVYGLNAEKMNPTRLFNLLCLYGNVARVKFLRSKEGTAMVHMEDGMGVDRALQNLNRIEFFGARLQITHSKQPYLNESVEPYTLPDGSNCIGDFTRDRNNRYLDQKSASKNRIIPPTHILHYYNAPPNMTVKEMNDVLASNDAPIPQEIKPFPPRSTRSSSGLMEFSSVGQAVEVLVLCNHVPVPHGAGQPFTLKLCFSSSRSMTSAQGAMDAGEHFQ